MKSTFSNFLLFLVIISFSAIFVELSNAQLVESQNNTLNSTDNELPVLSRRKRYLAFPEGSSFSVSYCGTFGAIGDPQYIFLSWAINWGIAYDLPNETWIINQNSKPMPKPVVQRRYRRELYNKLEKIIDNMGYPGKSCMLRALCESSQYFSRRKSNMVEELLKSIFSLPVSKVLPFEHQDLMEYDAAHRKGKSKMFCEQAYPDCNFSLISLGLGEYSNPFKYMK